MAMGLSATEHDIVELKPSGFGDWIAGSDQVDALVLDLEAPALAAAAVVNLRAHGKTAPALLVSTDRPGWHAPEMSELVTVSLLPQPITRVALLAAVESMLTRSPSQPDGEPFIPEAGPPDDAPLNTAEALNELRRDEQTEPPAAEDDEIERLFVEPRPAGDDLLTTAASPIEPGVPLPELPPTEPATEPSPAPAAVRARRRESSSSPARRLDDEEYTLSAVPRTRRSAGGTQPTRAASSKVLNDIDQLRTAAPQPAPRGRPTKTAAGTRRRERQKKSVTAQGSVPAQPVPRDAVDDPADLVQRLGQLAGELYGVPETAQVVIADAVDRVSAEAGAILCPDEGAWRVSGGVQLRALEHRSILQPDSWLVQEIAERQRGVIIEDTDIAREKLHGTPLASWRHLLAAPVPDVKAVLILARRQDVPFTEADLGVLARIGTEAGPLLKAAMDTRELARVLSDFRDDA